MTRLHLNLGCGSNTIRGFVNVDRVAAAGVDLVHDLDTPWPWEDGRADRVEAKDIFEHVADPVLFMTEAHRVLCDGGTMFIRTPHWQHEEAYTDPTHRRFPTEHTFDFWIVGTLLHRLHNAFYGGVSFHRDHAQMEGGSMLIFLSKIGDSTNAARGTAIDINRGHDVHRLSRSRADLSVVDGAADQFRAAGERVPALTAAHHAAPEDQQGRRVGI